MAFGDFLSGINNSGFGQAMSNPLVQQYLAGISGGLTQGGFKGGIAAGNQITQQNIQNKNYMKMVQKMLAGDMSGGGKLTMDKDGIKIHIPTMMDSTINTPLNNNPIPGGGSEVINPFDSGQPKFSVSDLAGLNPELISQALKFGMESKEAQIREGQLALENKYKQKLMEQIDSQIAENAAQAKHNQAMEDIAKYKAENPDKPAEMIMYEYDKANGFKGSIKEWRDKEPDSSAEIRLVERAMKDPKFAKELKNIKAAGSTKIEISPKDRVLQTGEGDRINDVKDPGFYTKVLKELESSDSFDSAARVAALASGSADPEGELPKIKKRMAAEEMEKRIKLVYPKAVRTRDGWYIDGKLIQRMP